MIWTRRPTSSTLSSSLRPPSLVGSDVKTIFRCVFRYSLPLAASHQSLVVQSLDTLASQHSTSLGRRLSLSSLTHWRLQTRLSLSLRSSSTALLSRSLSTWLASYEHLETELLGRALAFSGRKDGQLLVVSFSAWADASEQRARLASAADAVYRRGALAKALGRWRKRVGEVRMGERKAEVVRGFMSQRAAWRVWVEKSWERKRTRWVEEKKQVRMKEALDCAFPSLGFLLLRS